jgi:hypothetical protein
MTNKGAFREEWNNEGEEVAELKANGRVRPRATK